MPTTPIQLLRAELKCIKAVKCDEPKFIAHKKLYEDAIRLLLDFKAGSLKETMMPYHDIDWIKNNSHIYSNKELAKIFNVKVYKINKILK